MTKDDDINENTKKLALNNETSGFDRLNDIEREVIQTPIIHPIQSNTSIGLNIHSLTNNLDDDNGFEQYVNTSSSEIQNGKFSKSIHGTSHKKVIRSKSQPLTRTTSEASVGRLNKLTRSFIIPAAKWAYSPLSNNRGKRKYPLITQYKIEYSVFKPLKHCPPVQNDVEFNSHWQAVIEDLCDNVYPDNYMSATDFGRLLLSITDLIELYHSKPERISQGSSGSYFIYDKTSEPGGTQDIRKAGIFKPKDEEPYGPLSPKWTKWLHRTFFPCFFGRSCLIPNLGYISEAAASILDQQLLSYIVPHTEIIYLKSRSFYYSYWDRHKNNSKLPSKIGSFQCFLKGYVEAQTWFQNFAIPNEVSSLPDNLEILVNLDDTHLDSHFKWNKRTLQQFREELEKLVILDYIMRNTDRGLDNWMIKIEWREIYRNDKLKKVTPVIRIGAIDSGLAFPWKHPDEWRSFPFGWLFLPLSIIGQPFSIKTRKHYLPLLTSTFWWERTITRLKDIFEQDNDFKKRLWNKQLSVLKGQAFNVVEILKISHAGPLELTRRENLLIRDDLMNVPILVDNHTMLNAMETSIYELNNKPSKYKDSFRDNRIDGWEPNESSPLLDNSSFCSARSEPRINMSGFEYNLNFNEHLANDNEDRETDTKEVIIERLEKVVTKSPVFTWC